MFRAFSKKTVFILTFFCLTLKGHAEDLVSKKSYIFEAGFKEVWAAAQTILGNYPLETNDLASGLMRTTELKQGQFWQAPFEPEINSKYKQTLTFKFFKANPNQTEVQILKHANIQTDFLGSNQDITTEPWEQLRLFYKIKREIEIKRILKNLD